MEESKIINVAIVGGGPGCKAIMDMIFAAKLSQLRMNLIGVACTNPKAVGYLYAKEKGIYTTTDYRDLYELSELSMIIELTGRGEVANEIYRTKPDRIRVMGNVAARLFWDVFQIEEERIEERRRAERESREREEHLQAILDSIQTGVLLIDAETHVIVETNPLACRLIGRDKEEIIGHICHEFVCPAKRGKCPITDMGQQMDNSENVLLTSDKGRLSIIKTVVPVFFEGKRHLLESFLDITERKKVEDELRESQERYYTVLEACPDPVVVYDMKGRGTYINPAFTRVFGWTPGEILGMKLQYVPKENWPETKMMIDKVLAGESFTGVESRRYTKAGNILDVSISAAIYMGRDGGPAGSVHILRDITDRKLVEEALKKAHDTLERRVSERTRELAETTNQLREELLERQRTEEALRESEERFRVLSAELDSGLSEVFEALEEISSGNPEVRIPEESSLPSISELKHTVNLTAKSLTEIVDLSHEFAIGLAEHFEKLDRVSKGDLSARISGVSRVEILESLRKVTNLMIESVSRELSERKRTEKALRRAQANYEAKAQALKTANEELSQYAYVVSHDLKAPLRAIHSYGDFLREDLEGSLGPDQEMYLNGLNRAIRQGEELVDDLLEFSRVGKRRGPIEAVDLGEFFKDLVLTLDLPSDVDVYIAEDFPEIEADVTLLRQIFRNLIINAVKFNHSEKKHVELGWRDRKDTYELTVRDNGIGIDPQYAEQIFRVFQRLHTRKEYDGTGLGLAIVKKAVLKLNGTVGVESAPGKGSTFFVTLPQTQRRE
jgi:PAS domain S-box-containing protein